MKRVFDVLVSICALLVTAPLWIVAAISVAVSSRGPIFYHALRAGRGGQSFRMLKFRTMHVSTSRQSEITAPSDSRVFPAGKVLRLLKIDELPQLLNILKGEMSIVGPRPESYSIVQEHYTDWMMETLSVPPGLTSVGALFGYSFSDDLLDPDQPEESYLARVMPPKLALERAYLERASFAGDMASMLWTGAAILAVPMGKKVYPSCRDIDVAGSWVPGTAFPAEILARCSGNGTRSV